MAQTFTGVPPALVPGPARQPFQYGLGGVVSWITGDGRWESGANWESLTCAQAEGIGAWQCPPGGSIVGLPKEFNAGANGGHASAFTVYGTWSCSPVGYTPEQAQQRATEHLLAFEEARVERAFWTGDLDNEPSLKGATDLGGGGSASITAGVSILEDYIASTYGSLGVIHMTRGAALAGLAADVLTVTDGKLVTKLGTPVVAGAGYPGTGPAGEAPGGGFTWAYATPAIFGYKSDVFTSSSVPGDLLDREQNDMYAVAERNYLLGFDPCGVATVRLALL